MDKIIRAVKKIKNLWLSIYGGRHLLFSLAKKDFERRFAGSYLGTVWAFIQPLLTMFVYWFVFRFGFRAGDVGGVPFTLWFMCGIVPWLYFSEAFSAAANSLMEYGYLVKKVVFNIDILPLVKIMSSAFIHFCFTALLVLIGCFLGYWPNGYFLQLPYYLICMWALVFGISLFTSAIMVFFRDLNQIIGIILLIGMWGTPIAWNVDIVPHNFLFIIKMNPLFYIVEGYRESIIGGVWFWHKYNQTLYFWILTGVMLIFGSVVFNRLRPHFADVL